MIRATLLAAVCTATLVAGYSSFTSADDSEIRDVIDRVGASVVTIEVPGNGQGSGFVVNDSGAIVTNFHVIAGSKEAKVIFRDGMKAKVAGFLTVSTGRDLALLQLEKPAPVARPLSVSMEAPAAGDRVFAFGAPRSLRGSVTDGIVSAVRHGDEVRDILKQAFERDIYTELLGYDLDATWVQTSAPISAGNSGGPVVNQSGAVVAVATWTRPDGQNLNFAISGKHVSDLMEKQKATVKPLSELPAARVARKTYARGNAEKTLAFWKQRSEIEAEMLAKMPKATAAPAKKVELAAARCQKMGVANSEYARRVRQLDTTDVDEELVAALNEDADVTDEMAKQWHKLEGALRSKDRKTVNEAIKGFDELDRKNRETFYRRFDSLRQSLSKRYEISFPSYIAGGSGTKAATSRAAGTLKLATDLLKAGKTAAAKERLEGLLRDHPDSEEAREAERLLNDKR